MSPHSGQSPALGMASCQLPLLPLSLQPNFLTVQLALAISISSFLTSFWPIIIYLAFWKVMKISRLKPNRSFASELIFHDLFPECTMVARPLLKKLVVFLFLVLCYHLPCLELFLPQIIHKLFLSLQDLSAAISMGGSLEL